MISRYFEHIENVILNFNNISSHSIEKKYYSHTKGFIKGIIIFTNGYKLEFMEVKDTEISSKDKYKYHFMDEQNNLIFRYDNAPHHREIKTFPHHKHLSTETIESDEPDLLDILLEIRKII